MPYFDPARCYQGWTTRGDGFRTAGDAGPTPWSQPLDGCIHVLHAAIHTG